MPPKTTPSRSLIPELALAMAASALLLSPACSHEAGEQGRPDAGAGDSSGTVIQYTPDPARGAGLAVEEVMDHDPLCFTQGLAVVDSVVYESSGLYGNSFLCSYRLGEMEYARRLDLPDSVFAEGLAVVGDTIYLLTWREGTCLLFDREGFEPIGSLGYEGEGWGLAWDGTRLIQSDGSECLVFRDPRTFREVERIAVTASGSPVGGLNELEYVSGLLYANIWPTDLLAIIDPADGTLLDLVNASGLLTPEERRSTDVLNGIAWDASSGRFLMTGKLWPKMFVVDLAIPDD
jgi:glutamine cyclotransferase